MTAVSEPLSREDMFGHKCNCGGEMVRLEVDSRLSVHLPGDTSECAWTASPLDSWTCTVCGRTEFFARNPGIFR